MTEKETIRAFLRPLASEIMLTRISPRKEPRLKMD
jgi:hypothetical protein